MTDYTRSTAQANGGDETFTIDALLEVVEKVKELNRLSAEPFTPLLTHGMANFCGLRVHESPYAVQTVPLREHKKRHNQSEMYHRRVQKKWTKRWGTKQVPCAYMLMGKDLILNPAHVPLLKNVV